MAIITCGKSGVGLFQSGTSYEKDIKELELISIFFIYRKCLRILPLFDKAERSRFNALSGFTTVEKQTFYHECGVFQN